MAVRFRFRFLKLFLEVQGSVPKTLKVWVNFGSVKKKKIKRMTFFVVSMNISRFGSTEGFLNIFLLWTPQAGCRTFKIIVPVRVTVQIKLLLEVWFQFRFN